MLVCVRAPGLRIEEGDTLGLRPVNALDELVLGVALEGEQLVAALARDRRRALLDRLQRVAAVDRRLPGAQQIEVRAVK